MRNIFFVSIILMMMSTFIGNAQKIYYTAVEDNEAQQTHFDIIGKINSNILIYTGQKNNHTLSVYDMDMKLVQRKNLNSLSDHIIDIDFINYHQQGWIIYQFQENNIVYCKALSINANGDKIGNPIDIDSTEVSSIIKNKIYSLIISDDKQKIMLFKINTKKERSSPIKNIITTLLLDSKMNILQKGSDTLLSDKNHYITNFSIDNQGNFLFTQLVKQGQEGKISNVYFITKAAYQDSFYTHNLDIKNFYLDDIKVKIDNGNKKYIFTSLYAKTRKGNVEGLYTANFDVLKNTTQYINPIRFNDELRNDARGDAAAKNAFNDYVLQNIVVKNDGSFIISGESFYTTSKNTSFNRWNYLYGYPYYGTPVDFFSWYPYNSYYPWWRTAQLTQFHAENIIILSINNQGNLAWSNVIPKIQLYDETDLPLGYQIVNAGKQLHFLFNQQMGGTTLLTNNILEPNGQITKAQTLHNLDQGRLFMPRYTKQVGAREAIIPCLYNNYLCFAKIEW